MKIGSFNIDTPVIAAPMAGVSDKPYRQICRDNGAGMVVCEMVTSRADLIQTQKTRSRLQYNNEAEPRVIQIVGSDPTMLAQAAQFNVANGAQIIDINMGCPAKKVCRKKAGSALLGDERLVAKILTQVVDSVCVPVTLKIRTGLTPEHRNGVTIAKIAEQAGIQSLTVHGRTRQCKFTGHAEYDTIAQIKQSLSIPVIANGDIDSPEKAAEVMRYTGCDAVMIGRAAQGRPWLFKHIADYLNKASYQPISLPYQCEVILKHLQEIHHFYGEYAGVRFARKHIKWYLQHWPFPCSNELKQQLNHCENSQQQINLMRNFLLSSINQLAA